MKKESRSLEYRENFIGDYAADISVSVSDAEIEIDVDGSLVKISHEDFQRIAMMVNTYNIAHQEISK